MAKYVKVENNEVIQCLHYLPENAVGDWREAIEIEPSLIPTRQIRGFHSFDLTKTPVEIIWSVINLTVDERKNTLLGELDQKSYETVQKELVKEFEGQSSNFEFVQQAIFLYRNKRNNLLSFTTHEEIDTFLLENP
jgi:hypothetical protein